MWKLQPFLCPLRHVTWQAQCSNLKRQRRKCPSENILHTESFKLFTSSMVILCRKFRYQNSENLIVKMWSRHVAFSGFTRIPVLWNFFAGKFISEIHVKKRKKLGGWLIIYIFLIKKRRSSRRDYLFCINRTKEIELFTKIIRCFSEKDEVICSANK